MFELPRGAVAVIFVSQRKPHDDEGYAQAAAEMANRVRDFPGFLGMKSARGEDGVGVTVSYWASEEAAKAWRADAEHTVIREQGRKQWYSSYDLQVAEINRSYSWRAPD